MSNLSKEAEIGVPDRDESTEADIVVPNSDDSVENNGFVSDLPETTAWQGKQNWAAHFGYTEVNVEQQDLEGSPKESEQQDLGRAPLDIEQQDLEGAPLDVEQQNLEGAPKDGEQHHLEGAQIDGEQQHLDGAPMAFPPLPPSYADSPLPWGYVQAPYMLPCPPPVFVPFNQPQPLQSKFNYVVVYEKFCLNCGEPGHEASLCMRYKTSICKFWKNGMCTRLSCNFAHGHCELRRPWKGKCSNVVLVAPKTFAVLGCGERNTHTYANCNKMNIFGLNSWASVEGTENSSHNLNPRDQHLDDFIRATIKQADVSTNEL